MPLHVNVYMTSLYSLYRKLSKVEHAGEMSNNDFPCWHVSKTMTMIYKGA